jgi:hypothetical protein
MKPMFLPIGVPDNIGWPFCMLWPVGTKLAELVNGVAD